MKFSIFRSSEIKNLYSNEVYSPSASDLVESLGH